jgi:hypothetical protein
MFTLKVFKTTKPLDYQEALLFFGDPAGNNETIII